jgi:diguanylate cyclase (GGDEF)-like protein
MSLNYNKPEVIKFISYYLLFMLIFSVMSYKLLINDPLLIEKTQNKNNINTILNKINTNITNISNIIRDYSQWDDTHNFIINSNKDYIYENFREGTSTLEDLDLDFIIFSNKEIKVVFSKYEDNILKKDKQNFEKNILTKFKKDKNLNTIIKYNTNYLYLVKSKILKSDKTGKINGWIYSGKIITDKELAKISKAFISIKISQKEYKKNNYEVPLEYFKNIKINTKLSTEKLINSIQFYNTSNDHIFSIVTENKRNIVNHAEKTIYLFNIIVASSIFIISFFIYRNQIMLSKYNKLLELKVNRRTSQLSKTLRKLKNKNNELYILASIDSLTKIRNRRSYFLKSSAQLHDAILEDKNFCILMIDIDHFKKVNDTYGHSVGDKVLIEFCNIINSLIEEEIFGRIGGEEFCITFFNKNNKDICVISENIRKKCADSVIKIDNENINFTVSLGLSCRNNFTNIDEILQVSDDLLYKAKKEGRNRLIRSNPH